MPLSIDPVQSPRDLHEFTVFPWTVYRGDPDWVPPLIGDFKNLFNRAKHPFHQHSEVQPFLARRDGAVVGRIAAVWNRNHQEFHKEPVGFFGFFETIDDRTVAAALFDAAAAWLRERGLTAMRGPASFSSNEEWGLLVDGWNGPPKVMMTYNPRWYPALFEACGLVRAKDLVAYFLDDDNPPERLVRGAAIVEKRNPDVVIRSIDMKRFEEEVRIIRELYNKSWERNWGFVPMTEAEIEHMAREMKPIVDPGLVMIAEKNGAAIGFSLSLPDANQALKHANGRLFPFGLIKLLWHARKIRAIRTLTLGVVPEHRHSGVDVLMYLRLFRYGAGKGYTTGEFSWMLEDNVAIRKPMENIGARVYRTYRIYERAV